MRKLFLGLGLSLGLLGLAGPGEAFEYLGEPAFHKPRVQTTAQPVRLAEEPEKIPQFPYPLWFLSAELRDSGCPACQFPAFLFPNGFGVDLSQPQIQPFITPSAHNSNQSAQVTITSAPSFILDTTGLASCQQELNSYLYQQSVIPVETQLAQLQGLAGL